MLLTGIFFLFYENLLSYHDFYVAASNLKRFFKYVLNSKYSYFNLFKLVRDSFQHF